MSCPLVIVVVIGCLQLMSHVTHARVVEWTNEQAAREDIPDTLSAMGTHAAAAGHPRLAKRDTEAASSMSRYLSPEVMGSLRRDLWEELMRRYNDHELQQAAEMANFMESPISKRKAFWQPLSGPLPVETRFTSFGSRIQPDKNRNKEQTVLKAMRYGRR